MTIPTKVDSVLRLAEIGGIPPKVAREIYDEVEAATLGYWRHAATEAHVPAPVIAYWEKEMAQQTRTLREDGRAGGGRRGR